MPRFEEDDKFWEIVLEGTTVRTRSGRVGTDGRLLAPKSFPTLEKATRDYEKRIAEQRTKGRAVVSEPPAAEPSNPALEELIVEDPSDAGRYLVYADWLQSQGHPRGELGALQNARAQNPTDAALAKAEQKLLDRQPELAPARFCELVRKPRKDGQPASHFSSAGWEHGFIAVARVARSSERPPYTVRELVVELLAHPAARFLRELRIGPMGPAGTERFSYEAVIGEIVRVRPPALRILSLVDLPPDAAELGFSELGDLTELCAALPLLEELHLAARSLILGASELPKLRRLSVVSSDADIVASLPLLTLPVLEELSIACGEANVAASALKLLDATCKPRRLALTRTGNTDELIPFLARSKLLAGLEVLDLSAGRLTDAGGQALLANPAPFAHLTTLDVSSNSLSLAMTKQLASVCAEVRAGSQRSASRATLTEKELLGLAPDAGALAKARAIAKPAKWSMLARDDTTYWGSCRGSEGVYEVYLRLPGLECGCSCPSQKYPCKHAIALAVLVTQGHAFEDRAAPRGLFDRATTGRYYGAGE